MSIHEEFEIIPGCSNYEISNFGRVINRASKREMRLTPVTGGDLSVAMMSDDGKQVRRSVKVLVAKAFVANPFPPGERDPEDGPLWDTPVILDGDDFHLHADNIVWRPRWFAIAYRKQMDDPLEAYWAGPVVERSTGVVYKCVMDAAMETGSLPSDILLSMVNDDEYPPVFPHRERFDPK